MNQLRKPAMPEENCSIGTPISAGTVEYDDGNPATIAAGAYGFD